MAFFHEFKNVRMQDYKIARIIFFSRNQEIQNVSMQDYKNSRMAFFQEFKNARLKEF